jgi:hypothetical protein
MPRSKLLMLLTVAVADLAVWGAMFWLVYRCWGWL